MPPTSWCLSTLTPTLHNTSTNSTYNLPLTIPPTMSSIPLPSSSAHLIIAKPLPSSTVHLQSFTLTGVLSYLDLPYGTLYFFSATELMGSVIISPKGVILYPPSLSQPSSSTFSRTTINLPHSSRPANNSPTIATLRGMLHNQKEALCEIARHNRTLPIPSTICLGRRGGGEEGREVIKLTTNIPLNTLYLLGESSTAATNVKPGSVVKLVVNGSQKELRDGRTGDVIPLVTR